MGLLLAFFAIDSSPFPSVHDRTYILGTRGFATPSTCSTLAQCSFFAFSCASPASTIFDRVQNYSSASSSLTNSIFALNWSFPSCCFHAPPNILIFLCESLSRARPRRSLSGLIEQALGYTDLAPCYGFWIFRGLWSHSELRWDPP